MSISKCVNFISEVNFDWIKPNASQKDNKLPAAPVTPHWSIPIGYFISFRGAIEFKKFKGSQDRSHFIFETNVGKRRIRHRTTLNLKFQSILRRSRNSSLNSRVVVCRIRLFPTLISKIKWLASGLHLNSYL